MIGAPCLCVFLFIAFAGMDWVTRIQKALLVLLIFAQVRLTVKPVAFIILCRLTCCWEVSWTLTRALCMCRRTLKDKSLCCLGRFFTHYDELALPQLPGTSDMLTASQAGAWRLPRQTLTQATFQTSSKRSPLSWQPLVSSSLQ